MQVATCKSQVTSDSLPRPSGVRVHVTMADLQYVRRAHQENFWADLNVKVFSESGVGKLLQAAQSAGLKTWSRFDESIEIVFPSPVSSPLIAQIKPLYRTNKEFKRDRWKQCKTF